MTNITSFRVSQPRYFVRFSEDSAVNEGSDGNFAAVLEFDIELTPQTSDLSWIDKALEDIRTCLVRGL